jgi:hypothetical protein
VSSHRMFVLFINSKMLIIMHLSPYFCYVSFLLITLLYATFLNTAQVYLNCLTIEDGTDMLSRNVSKYIPIYAE